jgi:uncharacterized protein (DUF924 family)
MVERSANPSAALEKLQGLLTPSLLRFIIKTRLPYSRTGPIDFFGRSIFIEGGKFGPLVRDQVWPVLIALSEIDLENMPDLCQYLPPPTDPSYLEQYLRVLLLVDHCPRSHFRGANKRWIRGCFSPLSQHLARTSHSLPPEQRPDSWARWRQVTSLDYWIAVRFWLVTPFVHSEAAEDQEIAVEFTEETRTVVEQASGVVDPYRTQREAILTDLYGFPMVFRAGPPQGTNVTREGWTFWMAMLMDVHKPIIDRYGRYPYLNSICGRDSTAEEREWIENTQLFAGVGEETAKMIKQDIERGQWTPLGQGFQNS